MSLSTEQFLEGAVSVFVDAETKGLKKGNGGCSDLACVICGGTVKYTVAGNNGHVWARCSTDDCVRFMQ